MSKYIHKSHKVSSLMYHLVFPAKYRRIVIDDEVDKVLKEVCLEIEKRYEIIFLEIGTDKDHVHFLVQSVPTYKVQVVTAKRKNQEKQNPEGLDTTLGSLRQRMEGVFNELQNLGKNLERLLAKTVVGLGTRVAALVSSHTLKLFLRKFCHMDVQFFSFID